MCVWDPSIVKANNGEKEPFYKLGEGHTNVHPVYIVEHSLLVL